MLSEEEIRTGHPGTRPWPQAYAEQITTENISQYSVYLLTAKTIQ